MANEIRSSDLADPLQNFSVLSLFPRTFSDSTNAVNPNDPNDIESIHTYLKSMALRSPNKLIDQAKTIVDRSALMKSKSPSHVASKDENENVAAMGKENPQARRPGLGLKRPRFSWKPNSSQPAVSLEPSFDIGQLKDPEECFLAFQKFENAKKELQRQRGGVLMDLDQNNRSTTERCRRPGILGKSVHFKRRHSSMLSNNDETFISSQETNEQDILSPSNSSLQEITNPDVASQEGELASSIAKSENRANELLGELLSQNWEDLDGDGALTILQKHLQIEPILPDKLWLPDLNGIRRNDFKALPIKPILPDKLCIPDLYDSQRNDSKAFGGDLPKPRNSLPDIHNKLKGISKTPVKHRQEAESFVDPFASPTPSKSPLASISLLKRHLLKSSSSHDPFSALNIDLSPPRNSSPVECIDKQSDQVDMGKELSISGKLKLPILDENDAAVANTCSLEVVTEDSTRSIDKTVNDKLGRVDVGFDVRSSGSHGDLQENIGGCNMDDDSSRPVTCTDAQTNGASELDDKIQGQDPVQDAVAFAQSDVNVEDSTMEELNRSQSKLDQSSSATVEYHAMDGPREPPDICPEHHIEKIQEPSRIIMNEQNKEKTPQCQELDKRGKENIRPRKERKREKLSRRQSLAGAGTSWQSGVRRSTRIKIKPLEYWKGERFLYGRIHESLSTVIGLKYASPGKGDGKPTLKVKSYVSDEYKELVELATLH